MLAVLVAEDLRWPWIIVLLVSLHKLLHNIGIWANVSMWLVCTFFKNFAAVTTLFWPNRLFCSPFPPTVESYQKLIKQSAAI